LSLLRRVRGELSSIEIAILADEIRDKLLGCRVANVYRLPDSSYVFRLSSEEGRRDLRIVPNKCLFLVEGVYEAHGELDAFAKSLRELVKGLFVKSVETVGGERIVKMVLGLREPIFSLVAELFPGGHIVLTDDRCIVKASYPTEFSGREYVAPPARRTVLDRDEAARILGSLDKNVKVGVALVKELGLGPKYTDEALSRAGVDASMKLSELSEDLLERVLESLESLRNDLARPSPRIYTDGEVVIPAPFSLRSLEQVGLRYELVGSFNEAVRKYYESRPTIVSEGASREAERLEKELLEKKKLISTLESEAEKKKRQAELIFSNLGLVEETRLGVLAGLSSSNVLSVDWGEGTFTIQIGEEQIKLLMREPASRQASSLFNDAKMILRGVENIKAEIIEITRKIEALRARGETVAMLPSVRALQKREWFENYRWSYTSGGRLLVAGRDASTNIKLLKKHLDAHDLVFHADVRGSPVVLLKDGKNATSEELEEAATFCGAYSRAWREELSSISVYMIRPDQVSFSPPPGTYLPRGSFIVKPPKTYFQVALRLCIGLREDSRRIVVGHERWVSSVSRAYVSIVPGEKKAEELAKAFAVVVKEKIGVELSREELEEFKSLIPYGKARIIK